MGQGDGGHHGLQNESDAPCGFHVDIEIADLRNARDERNLLRPFNGPLEIGIEDFSQDLERRGMLPFEARFLAAGPDPGDSYRPGLDCREDHRRPQYLPAPFPERPVDLEKLHGLGWVEEGLSDAPNSLKYATLGSSPESGLKVGLLVGRFQPFHYGHLAAVRFALKRADYLYIIVGSAQRSHERENPFTAGERIAMIKQALDGNGIKPAKWMAIPIVDADSHSLWVSSVKSMVPKFDIVFTNDSLTYSLFMEEGIGVKAVPYLDRGKYSATNVRDRILERKDWESLVPEEVVKIVKRFGGVERVQSLKRRDLTGGSN